MKFVLAPDSFKESMTAKEACLAMEKGIRKIYPEAECIHVPMADGGEGTLQSLVDAEGGVFYYKEVTAPLGNKVKARYGILGDKKTAVIEMAEASGIQLVSLAARNPLITTTYGVGELILDALNKGAENFIIGLGGSATNDGGVGMLQALGAKFLDHKGNEIGFGGGELARIASIDLSYFDKRIAGVKIEAACDVNNPLTGPNGASYVFGPQKGGNEETIQLLDKNLKHFAEIAEQQLNIEIDNIPGAGAAGGLGGAIAGFCNGQLKKGIEIVIDYTDLAEKIKDADYVFTGEGSIDNQTQYGKTPIGVSQTAQKYNVPVIAFAGRIGKDIDILYSLGITSIIGILPGAMELTEALAEGQNNIERAAENIVRLLK